MPGPSPGFTLLGRIGHGVGSLRGRVPIAFGVVACAVLSVAAVEFFYYPLDMSLGLASILVMLGVWLAAAVAVLVTVLTLLGHRRWWSAAMAGVIAVAGFASVIRVDLSLSYPAVYFQLHRSEFAAAAEFADSIPVDQYGSGEARLPEDQRDLANGWINVEPGPNGSRTAVVWMEFADGVGYGYAYAPSVTGGDGVLAPPTSMVTKMSLGGGWWWISDL